MEAGCVAAVTSECGARTTELLHALFHMTLHFAMAVDFSRNMNPSIIHGKLEA